MTLKNADTSKSGKSPTDQTTRFLGFRIPTRHATTSESAQNGSNTSSPFLVKLKERGFGGMSGEELIHVGSDALRDDERKAAGKERLANMDATQKLRRLERLFALATEMDTETYFNNKKSPNPHDVRGMKNIDAANEELATLLAEGDELAITVAKKGLERAGEYASRPSPYTDSGSGWAMLGAVGSTIGSIILWIDAVTSYLNGGFMLALPPALAATVATVFVGFYTHTLGLEGGMNKEYERYEKSRWRAVNLARLVILADEKLASSGKRAADDAPALAALNPVAVKSCYDAIRKNSDWGNGLLEDVGRLGMQYYLKLVSLLPEKERYGILADHYMYLRPFMQSGSADCYPRAMENDGRHLEKGAKEIAGILKTPNAQKEIWKKWGEFGGPNLKDEDKPILRSRN